jgi:hypothetical protein
MTIKDFHPGRIMIIRVDDHFAMMVEPNIVVRPRYGVEDSQPIEPIFYSGILIQPRLGTLSSLIAVEARLAVTKFGVSDA